MEVKKGMRVIDRVSKVKGTIVLAYRGELQIAWDNGLSGSFRSLAVFQNSGGVLLADGSDLEYQSTTRTF